MSDYRTVENLLADPSRGGISMYSNIDLLPHDSSLVLTKQKEKLKYLQLMKYFLEEIYVSLFYFKSEQLYKFDAHVGETLCQIRAYKILLLKHQKKYGLEKELLEFEEVLKKVYVNLQNIISEFSLPVEKQSRELKKKINKKERLTDFFKNKDIYYEIPGDIFFIFLSYFLNYFRLNGSDGNPISIDYERVGNSVGISKSYSKKIVKKFQNIISNLSCDFILALSREISSQSNHHELLPYLRMQTDNGRNALPCFAVMEIILLHMIQNEMNLLVITRVTDSLGKKHYLFMPFKGNRQVNDFSFIGDEDDVCQFNKEGCLVITGVSENSNTEFNKEAFWKKLKKIGLLKIMLMNMASHPQFSGDNLHHLKSDPCTSLIKVGNNTAKVSLRQQALKLSKRIQLFNRLACKYGCNTVNQGTFLARHIFCDAFNSYSALIEHEESSAQLVDMYIRYYNLRAELYKRNQVFLEKL